MLVVQTYGCNSVSRSKLNHTDCVDIGVAQILNEKMGIGVAISVIHSKTGHGAGGDGGRAVIAIATIHSRHLCFQDRLCGDDVRDYKHRDVRNDASIRTKDQCIMVAALFPLFPLLALTETDSNNDILCFC